MRLRDAIHANHLKAERTWLPDGKFTDFDHYEAFLQTLLFAHRNLGLPAIVNRTDPDGVDEEIRRIQALNIDLGNKGDRPPFVPAMSKSYAWGISYVLNGSALGAATMLKTGYIDANWPRRYLETARAYATSGRLAQFFRALDASPIDIRDAAQGAAMVFAQLASRRSFTPAVDLSPAKDTR